MAGVQDITIDGELYRRLTHVGFSHRQIQYLVGAKTTLRKTMYRHSFTRHQFRVLTAGATMKTLLVEGKFTRAQAKVLLDSGLL